MTRAADLELSCGGRHSSLYSKIPVSEWQSRRQLFSVVYLTVMANVMHSRSTKFFQCCSHDENKPGTAPSDGLVSGKERVRRKRGGSKINLRELVAANHATHCNNARRQGFQVSPPEVHSDCLTDGSSGTCSG